jgi:hypothetical protein
MCQERRKMMMILLSLPKLQDPRRIKKLHKKNPRFMVLGYYFRRFGH